MSALKLPCHRCHTAYYDICSMLSPIQNKKEAHYHMKKCIHCCLEYLLQTWNLQSHRSLFYKNVLSNPTALLSNFIVFKKFAMKREFFDVFFHQLMTHQQGQISFIRNSDRWGKPKDFVLSLLITALKSKFIKFVFRSKKNWELLLSVIINAFYDFYQTKKGTQPIWATLLSFYMNKRIDWIRSYLNKTDKIATVNMLESVVHGLHCIVSTHELELSTLISMHPMVWEVRLSMKCGNVRCSNNYAIHKYGIDESAYEGFETNKKLRDMLLEQSKNRKVVNKWYICKGCELVRYCSRKCQKISWNRQHHGNQCRILQKYKHQMW